MFKNLRQLNRFSLLLLAIAFVMSISQSTMTTAYPILMQHFHVDASVVQWLTTGFMIAMTLMMPLSPWLMDNVPLKRLLNGIVAVFLLGTAIAMVTPVFAGIIIGRLLEGLAVGALFPTYQALIIENTPVEKRGVSMGIVGLVMGSALAVGPIVSGFVLQLESWRWLFIIFFVILLVLIVSLQGQIKQSHKIQPSGFDFWSALLLLGFGGILYTVSILPDTGLSLSWYLYLVVSLAVLVAFIVRQLRLKHPFLNLSVFEYHGYLPAMLLTGISYSGLITTTVLMPLYYQRIFHLAPFWSGLLMVPAAAFLSLLNPRAGALLNRIGLRRLVVIGTTMMIVGYAALALAGTGSIIVGVIAAMLLEGGNAFIMMPSLTFANDALPDNLVPHGTAIITTMRQFIGAGSIVVATLLITSFNAHLNYGAALSHTAAWFILIPVLGLLLATQLKKRIKA
ncbi:MFS transporter [Lactobacillaceae bacterium L1_55_11]|nr:MFS transporter [Lactobacillaceae bacterium L1_55_11]